jgi:hypothetical protein
MANNELFWEYGYSWRIGKVIIKTAPGRVMGYIVEMERVEPMHFFTQKEAEEYAKDMIEIGNGKGK